MLLQVTLWVSTYKFYGPYFLGLFVFLRGAFLDPVSPPVRFEGAKIAFVLTGNSWPVLVVYRSVLRFLAVSLFWRPPAHFGDFELTGNQNKRLPYGGQRNASFLATWYPPEAQDTSTRNLLCLRRGFLLTLLTPFMYCHSNNAPNGSYLLPN